MPERLILQLCNPLKNNTTIGINGFSNGADFGMVKALNMR
jgi:hypothetical protein